MLPFSHDSESANKGDCHGESASVRTYQEESKSIVPFPAFFESLSRQIETLCACNSTQSAVDAVIDEDYTEYFGHMDFTQNNDTLATVHEDICSQHHMSNFPRVVRGGRRGRVGGVDESKEQECLDTMPSPEDESIRIRKEFYEPSQNRWFASTAFMVDDNAPKTAMLRKKAISAWLRPRPSSFDMYAMSSGRSAFDQYGRPQDYCVDGIAIEEDTEDFSVKKAKSQHATIGAYYFADVECYTRHRDSDVIPPISTADTYTTVSLCHSMDSMMDSTDPLCEEEDDEDVIVVDRESISHETVSRCFRLSSPKSPPSAETLMEPPATPPKLNIHRSLQRMTPQHYIHGDNPEDDQLYWSLAYSQSSKFSYVETDPSNPPPMMPELH